MKNEIPETPDFIHEMIKNEVEKQIHRAEEFSEYIRAYLSQKGIIE